MKDEHTRRRNKKNATARWIKIETYGPMVGFISERAVNASDVGAINRAGPV